MTLRVSSGAVRYQCHSSGKCCNSYKVGVDPEKRRRIEESVSALPEYAGSPLFEPGMEGSFLNSAMLARKGNDCVFLLSDKRCDLHARFGKDAKPLVCQQYPFLAVGTPRGVSVGLLYSCPSAVLTLAEEERFEVVVDPPGVRQPPVTKQVPAGYPLLLAPGKPIPWEGLYRTEDWMIEALQDRSAPLRQTLYAIRWALERLDSAGEWDPARTEPAPLLGPGDDREALLQMRLAARFMQRRRGIGISHRRTDQEVYRYVTGLLAEEAPRRAWAGTDPAWEGLLRRYLCGKVHANLLFIEQGIMPAFQGVLVLHCLTGWVAQALSSIRGAPLDLALVRDAIEYAERLFPHDDRTFSLWSREEAEYETTTLPFARILLA